jgi:hypothetical protein
MVFRQGSKNTCQLSLCDCLTGKALEGVGSFDVVGDPNHHSTSLNFCSLRSSSTAACPMAFLTPGGVTTFPNRFLRTKEISISLRASAECSQGRRVFRMHTMMTRRNSWSSAISLTTALMRPACWSLIGRLMTSPEKMYGLQGSPGVI